MGNVVSSTTVRETATSEYPGEGEKLQAISVDSLTKTYGSGDDTVRAVDGVSFDVEPGTVVGLLGPNGAGKTTTIKSMLGLVLPSEGAVTVEGIDVHSEPNQAYDRVAAMLEGARNVYWRLTVRENLDFFASLGGHEPADVRERQDTLLEQFGLTEKADEPLNELSRGMKQKVSLAATLARDPDVAFLDEPTLGLDVESSLELRRELRRLAERESMTVLLSSHDMDVVQDICDRVIIMNEGQIIADDSVENLIDLFRTRAYRVTVDGVLPSEDRRLLDERFEIEDFDQTTGRTLFDVSLPTAEALFDLVDALRETGVAVESIQTVEPDLEDVFLRVTEEASGGENL